ncbi:MAG: retropepsin-like aspartic protease [Oscillatoria sp. PMC 1068.18]|nr:retropepsin-like aspartic protease [Oscillatoria sp. PMC 1068.18]
MKKLIAALVITTGLTVFPFSSYSQEQQGCFMVDSNGRSIDLGKLCGESSDASVSGVYVIPIKRREGGTPVIDVTFNENETFEMLFDTGATGTAINPQMAKTLGVRTEGTILVDTASQNAVPFPYGRLSSVAVGGMTVNNLRVGISPALNLGLLGQDFYGNHDVTIKENTIEIRARTKAK